MPPPTLSWMRWRITGRAQGQPALSINWGAWAGVGFADTAGGKRLAARLALAGNQEHRTQSKRWKCWDDCSGKTRPRSWRCRSTGSSIASFIRRALHRRCSLNLRVRKPAYPLQAGHRGEKKAGCDLLAAEPAERRQLLQSYLSEQVARVLGLSPSKLDLQQPLSNLGLDSLMAVELKNRIAVDLRVNVPMVKFLQGFSVDQAATQVLDQLTAEAPTRRRLWPWQLRNARGSSKMAASTNICWPTWISFRMRK